MNALIYLTKRTFVNRIKRSFSSPKRLVSLIALSAYWFFLVMRPMGGPLGSHRRGIPGGPIFDLPPMAVLQAFIFAGFAFLTLILGLSTSVQRLSFKPADVDVLFPTPLDPKRVLVFRFIRDYLLSLLIPLL